MYMVFDSVYLACRSRQLLQNISSLDFPCSMIFHEFHDICFLVSVLFWSVAQFSRLAFIRTLQPLWFKTVRLLLVFNALFAELPCSPSWMRINNGGNNTTVPRHPVLAMDPLRMQYVITTIPITNLMQTPRPTIPQLPQLLLQHSLPNPYPHPRHPTTQRLHSLALYPPISPPYQTHGPPATHTLTPIQYMVKHYSRRSSRRNCPENTIWQGSQSWTSFLGSSVALASRTTAFVPYPKDATPASSPPDPLQKQCSPHNCCPRCEPTTWTLTALPNTCTNKLINPSQQNDRSQAIYATTHLPHH